MRLFFRTRSKTGGSALPPLVNERRLVSLSILGKWWASHDESGLNRSSFLLGYFICMVKHLLGLGHWLFRWFSAFQSKRKFSLKRTSIKYSSRAEMISKTWALKYQDLAHNPKMHQCYLIWIEQDSYWDSVSKTGKVTKLMMSPEGQQQYHLLWNVQLCHLSQTVECDRGVW